MAKKFPKDVINRAEEIIAALKAGTAVSDLGGRRFIADRNIVSFKVGNRYRILAKIIDGKLEKYEVMSHETYNSKKMKWK